MPEPAGCGDAPGGDAPRRDDATQSGFEQRFAPQAREVSRLAGLGERLIADGGACGTVWRRWGAGPAVVLLHGGSGSWTHWIRNVESLAARGHTVLVPDMPGYGESDDVPLPHSARQIAAILATSLQVAGLPREFALVGFSFGAVVAAHLTAHDAVRVHRLVLVGAMGLGVTREREIDLRGWKRLSDPDEILAVHRHNLRVLMLRDEAAIDPLALYLHAANTARTRFISRFISRADALQGLLGAAGVDYSGIWGAHDVTAVDGVAACASRLREAYPAARFDVVDQAGHWVQYERADSFNQLLAEHLIPR